MNQRPVGDPGRPTLSKQTKKDERKGKGRRREAEAGRREGRGKGKGRERREEGRKKATRFWSWVVCEEGSVHSELSLVGWKNPPGIG